MTRLAGECTSSVIFCVDVVVPSEIVATIEKNPSAAKLWVGEVLFLGNNDGEVEVDAVRHALEEVVKKGSPESRLVADKCIEELDLISNPGETVDSAYLAEVAGIRIFHFLGCSLSDVDDSPGCRSA